MSKITDATPVDVFHRDRRGWGQFAVLSFCTAKERCERAIGPVVAVFDGTVVAASDAAMKFPMPSIRVVAVDRDENEPCECNTPSCCIDHTKSSSDVSCDTW